MSETTSRFVDDSELLDAIEAAAGDEPVALNDLPNIDEIADYVGLSAERVRVRCRRLEERGRVSLHESTAFVGGSRVTTMLTVNPEGGDQSTLEVDE